MYLTRSVLTRFVRESNPDRWIESPARFPLNHGLTPTWNPYLVRIKKHNPYNEKKISTCYDHRIQFRVKECVLDWISMVLVLCWANNFMYLSNVDQTSVRNNQTTLLQSKTQSVNPNFLLLIAQKGLAQR